MVQLSKISVKEEKPWIYERNGIDCCRCYKESTGCNICIWTLEFSGSITWNKMDCSRLAVENWPFYWEPTF
ncbi:unnamed protein product [Arctogadus glacialis]